MAKRVDANQKEIVATLRKCGCLVHVTSMFGAGFPDLVCATPNRKLFLVELKDGNKPPSAQRLTPKEAEFHAVWHDHVIILKSLDDVLDFVDANSY